MKTYIYVLTFIALFVAVFIMAAPNLISANDDFAVISGFCLMAISLPVLFIIGEKIIQQQTDNINKLKELLK